jgi:hypothetical protein
MLGDGRARGAEIKAIVGNPEMEIKMSAQEKTMAIRK